MMNLSDFSVEEIVSWRDKASERVNCYDKTIDDLLNEIDKLSNISKKDRCWIAKLNRHLDKKVFGYKTKIYKGD